MPTVFATLFIFALSLITAMSRPWRSPEWIPASIGAGLMLALGLVTIPQTGHIISQSWHTLLFLFSLLLFSAIAERSGLFDWAALHAAKQARGDGRRLYFNIFLLGSICTVLLSLDTTAILLTPIVFAIVSRLELPPRPFLIACCFIANTASLALPVSNLTNLLTVDQFHIPFAEYSARMMLPTVAAIAVNYLAFRLLYRKEIPARFETELLVSPANVIQHHALFRCTLLALAAMTAGYFVGPMVGVEIVWIGLAGTMVLLIAALHYRVVSVGGVMREVSWTLFPFVLGMFILVQGVVNLGLTQAIRGGLELAGSNLPVLLLLGAFGATAGSNLLNNLPMMMLGLATLSVESRSGAALRPAVYGILIGCNVGPNLTIVGSLATMIWLSIVRKKGAHISARDFFRAGLWATIPMIVAATMVLWLTYLVRP